jgi:predicted GNAT family N-acyltransferase
MSTVETPKKLKNVIAVVRVMDPKTEKVEFKITRSIDDSERRDWLLRTVMRGLLTNKIVEIVNQEDDKDE